MLPNRLVQFQDRNGHPPSCRVDPIKVVGICKRVRCVGLTERFNESLLLIRHHMNLENFVVAYGQPRNPARKGEVRKRILERFDKYRNEVHDRNRLDLELYDYAVRELYAEQVRRYGEDRLRHDLETEFTERRPTISEQFRYFQSVGFRKVFLLPILALRRRMARSGADGAR